ncbi:MAG TPA: ATP synthase F0 subunit C [Candidatus Polarisedimenticolia bacterium]
MEGQAVGQVMNLQLPWVAAAIGAGMAVIGGGYGIGRLAGSALEGIARQPQASGPIGTNMIIAAALIEGATLFAEVVCLILVFKTL